jgi:hypothetical protein
MLKLLANLSLSALDKVVLDYIKENPGKRLYQIDAMTINSHHQWGSKYVVQRLEDQGRIAVIRTQHGKKIAPRYFATV